MNILVWDGKAWVTQRVDARSFGLQIIPVGRRSTRMPPRAPRVKSTVPAMAALTARGGASHSRGRGDSFARLRPLTPRPVYASV